MKTNKTTREVLGFIVSLPILLAIWLEERLAIPLWISLAGMLCLAAYLTLAYVSNRNRKFKSIEMVNIDSMSGVDFERYLQNLLNKRGYTVKRTPASGDLGVDLIASTTHEKIAIQVKRYTAKVSRRAVSDAVAGMQHYQCTKAMVITNSYFTPGAVTLAHSTGCMLIDRNTLAAWVFDFQNPEHRNQM